MRSMIHNSGVLKTVRASLPCVTVLKPLAGMVAERKGFLGLWLGCCVLGFSLMQCVILCSLT